MSGSTATADSRRQLTCERLVEECGYETVAELVGANLGQDLTAQGMGIVNALWDNRDRIEAVVEQEESGIADSLSDGDR